MANKKQSGREKAGVKKKKGDKKIMSEEEKNMKKSSRGFFYWYFNGMLLGALSFISAYFMLIVSELVKYHFIGLIFVIAAGGSFGTMIFFAVLGAIQSAKEW